MAKEQLARETAASLIETLPMLMRSMACELRKADLLPTQRHILDLCVRRRWKLGELAKARIVNASTISRGVNALIQRGLISKVRDEVDRRAFLIEATPKGRQLLEQVNRGAIERLTGIYGHMTEEELTALGNGLAGLQRALAESWAVDGCAEELDGCPE